MAVAERVLAREGVRWEQCVMVGDDLPDVPLMKRVGLADRGRPTRSPR